MDKADAEFGGNSPQPPPSSATFNQEEFSAMATISTLISQNGRNPISTMCPHCHTPITTEIETKENETAKAMMKTRYTIIAIMVICFAVVSLIAVVAVIFMAIGTQAIWFALGMVAMIVVSVCGMCGCAFAIFKFKSNKVSTAYHDVIHHCPRCKTQLGVSDGVAAMKALDNRYRRRARY